MLDQPTVSFLDATASNASTPGGGAVAALAGALAAALASMSCNYTLGPEKYREREPQIRALLERSETLRRELQALVDRDIEAYGGFSAAMKLPKSTPEEKAARGEAMQRAVVAAAEVPLDCCRRSVDVLEALADGADRINPNLLSDVGCAVVLAEAAFLSARYNVLVNLKSMKNATLRDEMHEALATLCARVGSLRERALAPVSARLEPEAATS